jgi:hypothetical protein
MHVSNFLISKYYNKSYYIFFSNKSIKTPFYKLFSFLILKLYPLSTVQANFKNFNRVQIHLLFSKKPAKVSFFAKKQKNLNYQFKFIRCS